MLLYKVLITLKIIFFRKIWWFQNFFVILPRIYHITISLIKNLDL